MLSHLLLGTNNLPASRQFYDAMLSVLGAAPSTHISVNGFERYVWDHDGTRLMIATPRDGEACTHDNGFTLGFKATSVTQCTKRSTPHWPTGASLWKMPRAGAKRRAMTAIWPMCATRQASCEIRVSSSGCSHHG